MRERAWSLYKLHTPKRSISLCKNTWPASPTNHARDNSRQLLGMGDAPLGGKTTFNDFPSGVSYGKTHLNTAENLLEALKRKALNSTPYSKPAKPSIL